MRTVSPTSLSIWEGTPVEGEKYTRQQLHVLKLKRPNWNWFADRMVRLRPELKYGAPPPDDVLVACPIIAWSRCKTRVLIVTPSGETRWIDAQPKAKP